MAVSNKLSCTNEVIYAGLDCEWSTHDGTQAITRLLQISFPNEKVAVVILSLIKSFDDNYFPRYLKFLLENYSITFVGRMIGGDLKLFKNFEVNVKN